MVEDKTPALSEVDRRGEGDARTEPRKAPWYRQAAILISLAALVVSGVNAIVTTSTTSERDIRNRKADLRQVLTQLVSLRQEFLPAKLASIADAQARTATAEVVNTQRQIVMADAAELISRLGDETPASAYLVMAYERRSDSNHGEAEAYLMRALDATTSSPYERGFALREAGSFFLTPGARRNIAKGRDYFSQAADVFAKGNDWYAIYQEGLTFERWGVLELLAGDPSGKAHCDRARVLYEKLPPGDTTKQWLLDALEKNMLQASTMGGVPVSGTQGRVSAP